MTNKKDRVLIAISISVICILILLVCAEIIVTIAQAIKRTQTDEVLFTFEIPVEITDYEDRGMTIEVTACKTCGKGVHAKTIKGVNSVAEEFVNEVNQGYYCIDYLLSIDKLVANTMYSNKVEHFYKGE